MGRNRAGKPPSHRQLKVGEQIRKVLCHTLQRGNFLDSDLSATGVLHTTEIIVTQVSVSPDLRNALAYISLLKDVKSEAIIDVLNCHASRFRHCVAKSVPMRFHPQIRFCLDTRLAYGKKIEDILKEKRVQADIEINKPQDVEHIPA